jgi:glutamine synthetase
VDGSSISGFASVEDSDRLILPLAGPPYRFKLEGVEAGLMIGALYLRAGLRSPSDPRALLERILEQAGAEFGAGFRLGPEHEFFLLREHGGEEIFEASDRAGYCSADPLDLGVEVREGVLDLLRQCGIRHLKSHHEVALSQHEIDLECTDPLAASDQTLVLRYLTKKVAHTHGLCATFMPKPFNNRNRTAYHLHLSMFDGAGNNLFHDPRDKEQLSRMARQFMGGILKYGRECSIIMASSPNSYKAYVPEREAPISVGWGRSNRSSMMRVPLTADARNTRIELRSPDPSGNAYLQAATFIGMGLQGLRERLDCGLPERRSSYLNKGPVTISDAKFLPRSMFEALVAAEKSRFLKDFLGENVHETYLQLKLSEWERYRTYVGQFDRRELLDL